MAWSRADWREARQPERSGDSPATFFKSNRGKLPSGCPQDEPAERRRVRQQGHVIANLRRLIARGAEGSRAERDRLPAGSPKGERGGVHQRAGQLGDDLVPAGLAVFLFEEVLLQRRQGKEGLLAIAHGLLPIAAVQQVAGDAVLLQHDGDGLLRVVGRIALAAALGVVGEGVFELISEAEDHNTRQRES